MESGRSVSHLDSGLMSRRISFESRGGGWTVWRGIHVERTTTRLAKLDISECSRNWTSSGRFPKSRRARVVVQAKEGKNLDDFPRRRRIYSLFSSAAPGDVVLVSYGSVLATAAVVTYTAPDHLCASTSVDGVSLLGVFVLIASSVERFLEPLKNFLDVEQLKEDQIDTLAEQVGVAINAIKRSAPDYDAQEIIGAVTKLGKGALTTAGVSALVAKAGEGGAPQEVNDAMKAARACEINVRRIRRNTAVVFWGFASCVSMFLSEGCGVGILHTVGLEDVSISLDIVITGLAVGAGTQPLNKLLSKLEG
ncbi:hypothetical protein BSKO_08518 [Bryopsis sp. KO-2023]|nr:hypothetical protein BSKO_08518 [Bryopsis sp. KO-2023]